MLDYMEQGRTHAWNSNTVEGGPCSSTINEMMLQICEGIIRIFPNWNRTLSDSFSDLRAYGVFLVSSFMQDGGIGKVSLKSEKGRPCRMEKSWPGHEANITKIGRKWKTPSGNV